MVILPKLVQITPAFYATRTFIKDGAWKLKLRVILLLQSALQPLCGLVCSTIFEYSHQKDFYRVPSPAARQTPNLEDQRSNSRHQVPPTSETTLANPSSGNMGEKLPRILPKVTTSTPLLGSFTCRKFTTWDDGFTSPP